MFRWRVVGLTICLSLLHVISSQLEVTNDIQSKKKLANYITKLNKHGRESQYVISTPGFLQFRSFAVKHKTHQETSSDRRDVLGFAPNYSFENKVVNDYAGEKQREQEPTQMSIPLKRVYRYAQTSDALIKSLCQVKGRRYVCYKHGISTCHCKGHLADCSGKPYVPNIHYVPELPKDIECVIFQHNNVAFLDDSYFANVSNFRVVDFSYNVLRTVSKNTFARFDGSLEYLILNHNTLTYSDIRKVLKYPPSKRLDLIAVGITKPIPKNFFQPFANIPTYGLYLDLNYLPHFDLREFSHLKHLRYLSASNCSVNTLTTGLMPGLNFFYLLNNYISDFPTTCASNVITESNFSRPDNHPNTSSLFPNLKELNMANSNVNNFPTYSELCLPRLDVLVLLLNNISTIHSFSLKSLTALKVLQLDRMKTNITTIEPNAFSSQSLVNLLLGKCHINFASKNVSDQMFRDCPTLEVLYLDHSNFSEFSKKSFVNLFHTTPRLRYLYLGSSQLTTIPNEALSRLQNLKNLYMYLNNIKTIPPAAFDAMKSLEVLKLDQNKISSITNHAFSSDTIQRLKRINLSKNNFQCNCDLLWFQHWLKEAGPSQFQEYSSGYLCADRPGVKVTSFILSKQACLFSQRTYILFTVCLAIVIAVVIIFSIGYSYRWTIRIALYELKSARPKERPDYLAEPTHDVFIVYCNDDSPWVIDELLKKVEDEWGLVAFVHERDFEAGRMITDNIVIAMNTCRHILVVLSKRFTHSNWCNFELQLCQSHVIEHDLPSILVVELEPIKLRDMSTSLSALRSSTTFLEWPGSAEHEHLFWQRLERCVRQMKGKDPRGQVNEGV